MARTADNKKSPRELAAERFEENRDAVVDAAACYIDAEIAFEKPKSGNIQALNLHTAGRELRRAVLRYRGRQRPESP